MSLLDELKRRAANSTGTDTADGNKTYTVTIAQLPVTPEQMKAMPEATLKNPAHTAALTVTALTIYPVDRDAALSMLEFLHDPKGLSTYDKQFLADRFRDKDYVPRS